MLIAEVIGWIGTILILSAYFLLTGKKLNEASKVYHGMNLFGGISIVVNALINGAYPPATLNIVWSVIAAYGIVKGLKLRSRKFPEEWRCSAVN